MSDLGDYVYTVTTDDGTGTLPAASTWDAGAAGGKDWISPVSGMPGVYEAHSAPDLIDFLMARLADLEYRVGVLADQVAMVTGTDVPTAPDDPAGVAIARAIRAEGRHRT